MDHVWCWGWERRIQDCHHYPYGWHWCNHAQDAIIQCVSPPLWNIEWGFEDEKDKNAFVSGNRAWYVLFFKRVATPNMFIKCWPEWKAEEKLKIALYTDDFVEAETPPNLKVSQLYWSWIWGWLQKPWYRPYVYFRVDAAHCDMERIRAIQCDKTFEIPPDIQNSWCWEGTPRIPEEYTLLQAETPAVVNVGTTSRNVSALAADIASDFLLSLADPSFRWMMGFDNVEQ